MSGKIGENFVAQTPNFKELDDPAKYANDQELKHAALRYILDAWEEAVYDGIEPDCIATAAIFAALSDMISAYGEEPVAHMTERLPERIRHGEFTVARVTQ